jgi:hypothetical protein
MFSTGFSLCDCVSQAKVSSKHFFLPVIAKDISNDIPLLACKLHINKLQNT